MTRHGFEAHFGTKPNQTEFQMKLTLTFQEINSFGWYIDTTNNS